MLKELQGNAKKADEQSTIVRKVVKQQSISVEETKSKYVAIVDTVDSINKDQIITGSQIWIKARQ